MRFFNSKNASFTDVGNLLKTLDLNFILNQNLNARYISKALTNSSKNSIEFSPFLKFINIVANENAGKCNFLPPDAALWHEFMHAIRAYYNVSINIDFKNNPDVPNMEETQTTLLSNEYHKANNYPLRENYNVVYELGLYSPLEIENLYQHTDKIFPCFDIPSLTALPVIPVNYSGISTSNAIAIGFGAGIGTSAVLLGLGFMLFKKINTNTT